MNDYAVIKLRPIGSSETIVKWWCGSADQAINEAIQLNKLDDGNTYRAVELKPNGMWHSLTGESLYLED